ncbi:MAG: hypothetical protein ACO3WN_09135, partial [Burkholderiaceae bacterium]
MSFRLSASSLGLSWVWQRGKIGLVGAGFCLLQACSLTPIREAPAPIVGPGEKEGTAAAPAAASAPSAATAPESPEAPAASATAVPPAATAAAQEPAPAGFQEAPAGQIARLPPTVGRLT